MKKYLMVVLALFLTACGNMTSQDFESKNIQNNLTENSFEKNTNDDLKTEILTIKTADQEIAFKVEIADDHAKRRVGLMYRDFLEEKAGMLFIFENTANQAFWMKNTLIPLDMIFINEDFEIVYIKKIAEPCLVEPCSLYQPGLPIKYVLEINAGLSDKLNINLGDKVYWLNS